MKPFWIDTDSATEADRMMQFESDIYPIWAGVESRSSENEDEVEILHKQDLAIFESGYKVNRLGNSVQQAKKQKLSGQFKQVMED